MSIAYLDSSAIIKRYVVEQGSDRVCEVYRRALNGELKLSCSAWNIGEVLGVFDKYYRRGWLGEKEYASVKRQFIGETIRLLRLKILRIVPVRAKLLVQTWRIVEEYHVYEADALQIVSAKHVGAQELYTGDKRVYEVALNEGVGSVYLS